MDNKHNGGKNQIPQKPWYKKRWVWIVITIIAVAIPFIINQLYMWGLDLKEPNTAYSASDLLSFYGSFLSLIGTVVLGYVAICQNRRITDLNERAILIEEENNYPYLEAYISNIVSKNIDNPTWANEFVRSKYYAMAGKPTYHFTKYIKGSTSGTATEMTITFLLKNTSNVVITEIAFLSLHGSIPEKNGNLIPFFHDRGAKFECLNSSAIHPDQEIPLCMNFVTDDEDIKRVLLQLPTELNFLFEVSTLRHSYKEKIGLKFEVGRLSESRYDYNV